jgi:hypothetical protein
MELNREFCKYSEEQLNSGELSPQEKSDVFKRYEEKCGIK